MTKVLKNILLFSLVFILTLGVIDRLIFYSESVSISIYGYDNTIGRTLIPGSNYLYTTEGLGMGSVNKYGYLNRGYPPERTPNTFRIALVGDSYVEAFQLMDRIYFGRVMEDYLKQSGINAEVLNFGRSGFTLSDMYAYNKNFIQKFDPDLVLFFVENDDFSHANLEKGMPYPYISNDSLKLYYYPENKILMPWYLSLNQSSLIFPVVQMIRNSINLIQEEQTSAIILGKLNGMFTERSPEIVKSAEIAPDSLHKKILVELAGSSENIIVYRGKEPITESIKNEIIDQKILYVDINDTLNIISHDFNPYYWKSIGKEGHWNSIAHQVIGEFLAREISFFIKK